LSVLLAPPRAAPATTLTDLTSAGENESIHSIPAGAPPLLLNETFSGAEPPSTAEPDERLREAV